MKRISLLIMILMLVSVYDMSAQRQKIGSSQQKKVQEETNRQAVQATGRQAISEQGEEGEGRQKISDQATGDKPNISQDPITGVVVSVKAMTLGDKGTISRDAAKDLAKKGDPLLFKSGGKYYYVLTTDKDYWGEKLANYAGLSKVGIYGAKAKYNGVNVILAAKIVSLE